MSKNKPIPEIPKNGVSYNGSVERFIQLIAWFFVIVLTIGNLSVLMGAESNSEYAWIFFTVLLVLAFFFTKIEIVYRLNRESFSRTVSPRFLFSFLNKKINFSSHGFEYIQLTRSSGMSYGSSYGPPHFFIEISRKRFGERSYLWSDMVWLGDLYMSQDAASVYDFALEVQKLTGFEIVIDPKWENEYKR